MKVLSDEEQRIEINAGDNLREALKETLSEKKVLKALRAVQKKLKTGEINARHFQMDTCADKTSCGTIGCIGGWLGLELIGVGRFRLRHTVAASNLMDDAIEIVKNTRGMHNLFYTYQSAADRDRTPQEAVKAITAFFKGEHDPWSVVDAKAARFLKNIGD